MNAKPLYDRVIILQDEGAEKVGSLFIAENGRVKPRQGTVIKVGPGVLGSDCNHIPLFCKEGDKVIYAEFSGANVVIEGKEYIILEESKILAKL